MEPMQDPGAPPTHPRPSRQRGNLYLGLGFTLLAGVAFVVVLGVLGITTLGWSIDAFSASTAWAMNAVAITLIAGILLLTLVSARRTLRSLSSHEAALAIQAARHAHLATKVQSQGRAEHGVGDHQHDEATDVFAARHHADLGAQDQAMDGLAARHDDPVAVRPMRNHGRKAGVHSDPFVGGQVHPAIDVEGIGLHYSKLLVDLGVNDTKQLWNADAAYLAGALGVKTAAVEAWQCMAEMMAVRGVDQQYAELLVRADVLSIDELAAETAPPLLARMRKLEKRQGDPIEGNAIGIKSVQSCIDAAQAHLGLEPTVAHRA